MGDFSRIVAFAFATLSRQVLGPEVSVNIYVKHGVEHNISPFTEQRFLLPYFQRSYKMSVSDSGMSVIPAK
ncbi:MAG: hypothetical protein HC800_00905 [Phormidesmis sp. RL_2_1]|nr:hypothetical protein [Phormidesmis sp. RL_2_1]